MKISVTLIILLSTCISLLANSTYYQEKISQFKELNKMNTKDVVMLGDSITDRALWYELLDNKNIANRGISGDTTYGVLKRVDLISSKTKKLFLMIGINDILNGSSTQEIFANYTKIIKKLKEKDIDIYIQSTLHVGENAPQSLNQKVSKLNSFIKTLSNDENLTFIDLNDYLSPNGYLDEKYTFDELHLNGDAYKIWANVLKDYM
jgi:lysophospholipase L1-like esterase